MESKTDSQRGKRSRRRALSAEETRARILDAAEDLFGQRGVYAVSLREMNTVCGISQGVLHYHFGGREALVAAIIDRQLAGITEARRSMVEKLLEADASPGPREVAEVLVRPLAELAMQDEAGLRFIRFLGRLHQDNNELYLELVTKYSVRSNFAGLLERCFGDRSLQLIEAQLAMALDLTFSTLLALGRPYRSWQSALRAQPVGVETRVEWLLSFIALGLSDPLSSTASACR